MAPMKDLTSIGRMCSDFRFPYPSIMQVAKQLKLEPAMKLDGVSYYGHDAVTAIFTHLRDAGRLDHVIVETEGAGQ